MSEVKRYESKWPSHPDMNETSDGEYVEYSDYEALREREKELIEYVGHKQNCHIILRQVHSAYKKKCTCGLSDLLKRSE